MHDMAYHSVNHKKEVNMPEISAPLSWLEIFLLKKVLGLLNLVLFYLESELLDHDLQNEDRGGRPKKFEPFSSYASYA